MLMKVNCSVVSAISVELIFDDNNNNKNALIELGDIINVEFNQNGLRKIFTGKVINISTTGPDVSGWYIILDGSDDFSSDQARFSPASLLDINILQKANMTDVIKTPKDISGIKQLRVLNGVVQYTLDNMIWIPIIPEDKETEIKDEEGTIPTNQYSLYSDEIKDEVY